MTATLLGPDERSPRERRAAHRPARVLHGRGAELAVGVAVVSSAAAAGIHALAARRHFDESWGYGLFFVAVTLAQAVYALALAHPHVAEPARVGGAGRALAVAGVAGNALLIALYVVSRTVGVPLAGPHAGAAEALDGWGLAAVALEAAVVASLIPAAARKSTFPARHRARRSTPPPAGALPPARKGVDVRATP